MDIREKLLDRIKHAELSEQMLKETLDFIQLLENKEEESAFSRLSEKRLNKIWQNEEDAVYDQFLPKV